jgi:predicted transglutaminase-like cysteine proteinase
MSASFFMKRHFLMLLVCGATLGLVAVSGLSCADYYENRPDITFGMTESEIRAYITPECTSVRQCLQTIVGAPAYELSKEGFTAIRDWVAANVEYKSDEEQWGVEDYWQTPEETLTLYAGDCEDFAILLCTLLRAYGIPADQMYVAVGIDSQGYGHAFLIENWYLDGEWRAIEPQLGTRSFPPGRRFKDYNLVDFKLLRDYDIILGFNDSYYYDESFPWDES